MNNLKRFEDAQDGSWGYDTALQEMRSGRKQSHWIWYIFPQIKGLGHSYDAEYYGIDSLYEACQYLEHDILGKRLREITNEVLKHYNDSIEHIMGDSDIDVLKFRSCMTLFDVVRPQECFDQALETFFDGKRDENTLAIIQKERDYLYSDSAFLRYHVGYQDKGFFESGSYESEEIPYEKILPTLVDIYLKGERMKNMLHHYLYHRDFTPSRLSGVESTLGHYCHELIFNVFVLAGKEEQNAMVPQLKGWDDKILDVESAAETFDLILGVLNEHAAVVLEDYAKESLVKDENSFRYHHL